MGNHKQAFHQTLAFEVCLVAMTYIFAVRIFESSFFVNHSKICASDVTIPT